MPTIGRLHGPLHVDWIDWNGIADRLDCSWFSPEGSVEEEEYLEAGRPPYALCRAGSVPYYPPTDTTGLAAEPGYIDFDVDRDGLIVLFIRLWRGKGRVTDSIGVVGLKELATRMGPPLKCHEADRPAFVWTGKDWGIALIADPEPGRPVRVVGIYGREGTAFPERYSCESR